METKHDILFTREQIIGILSDFSVFFQSDECKTILKSFNKNEKQIGDFLDQKQIDIIQKIYGIDGEKGYADIKKIRPLYQNDPEVMHLLMTAAMHEEAAFNEAIGVVLIQATSEELSKLTLEDFLSKMKKFQSEGMNAQQAQQVQVALNFHLSKLAPEKRQEVLLSLTQNLNLEQKEKVKQQIAMMQQKLPELEPSQQQFVLQQIGQLQALLKQAETSTNQTPTISNNSIKTDANQAPQQIKMVRPTTFTMKTE